MVADKAERDDDEEDYEDEEDDSPPRRSSGSGETITCPMCGAKNSSRSENCAACGEELPVEKVRPRRRRTRDSVEVGEVLSEALETYKENFGTCLGAFLCIVGVVFLCLIPAIGLLIMQVILEEQQGAPPDPSVEMMAGIGASVLLAVCASFYFGPGWTRLNMALARGDEASVSLLFQSNAYVLPYLAYWILFLICLVLGLFAFCIGFFVVLVLGWPVLYVVCEARSDESENVISRTLEISKPNWGTTLVLGIVVFAINQALNFVAILPCIGLLLILMIQLFLQPYLQLLWATAYVKMSGTDR